MGRQSKAHTRCISLHTFQMLLPFRELSGVTFVSLQKDVPNCDVIAASTFPMERPLLSCEDFLDTARVIDTLDLVIGVDTSVAHLAAWMGKPVWLMLPEAADWRWGLEGEGTPWYPTMRLFRQTAKDGWADLVNRVLTDLAKISRERYTASLIISSSRSLLREQMLTIVPCTSPYWEVAGFFQHILSSALASPTRQATHPHETGRNHPQLNGCETKFRSQPWEDQKDGVTIRIIEKIDDPQQCDEKPGDKSVAFQSPVADTALNGFGLLAHANFSYCPTIEISSIDSCTDWIADDQPKQTCLYRRGSWHRHSR